MQGPASQPAAAGGPQPSLSQRAFPRRVRSVLEGILEYASDVFDRGLTSSLNEFEQQLFKHAEQARNNALQKQCLDALHEVKRGRADLVPRFLLGLEAALAVVKDGPKAEEENGAETRYNELSLVENVVLDETVTLREIASRAEVRNSVPLFLLGQRFAVVAGRPAFDAEALPVGPHSLCRILRDAISCLDLQSEYRQHFFRIFDRVVLLDIAPLYDALNTYLIRQRVLPNLTHVPVRTKPVPRAKQEPEAKAPQRHPRGGGGRRADDAAEPPGRGADSNAHGDARTWSGSGDASAGASAAGSSGSPRGSGAQHGNNASAPAGDPRRGSPAAAPSGVQYTGPRPLTAWPGSREATAAPADPQSSQSSQDTEMFDVLRQLLSGRRSLLGKLGNNAPAKSSMPTYVVPPEQVQSVLGKLQTSTAQPVMVDGKQQPRSITHVKQDLLAQLRQVTPSGQAPALDEEHGDTIDLVGMLFDHIMKDVRPKSPAANLLSKLQVPLLRVALDDKGFFTRKQHPARQMLNTIAESGAYWGSEDEADRVVVDKMNMLVDRVTSEFTGDLTLFDALLEDLSGHMQTQVRKAEVAERRHVEAARGKEKLELARLHAAEAIDSKLAGKRVPKFLHSMLAQAWTDVLSLAILREGQDSEGFQHQLQIAERLINSAEQRRTTGTGFITAKEIPGLKKEIESALGQVGYHSNDAQATAARLLAASTEEEEDDPASRTELAMKLKSRARLGQQKDTTTPVGEKIAPLNDEETKLLEQIRHMPFGAWFEFKINQQGDLTRRRLSWYSTVTGHCLFVNHRGQRVGEFTLNWMAREMHRGNLKMVAAEQDSLIDRALKSIMNALRSFSGRNPATADAAST